jgi:predicted DNA-binding transcriptional regulator AlpA
MEFLSKDEVCRLLRVKECTVRKYVRENLFPRPIAFSQRKKVWDKKAVDQWIYDRQLESLREEELKDFQGRSPRAFSTRRRK